MVGKAGQFVFEGDLLDLRRLCALCEEAREVRAEHLDVDAVFFRKVARLRHFGGERQDVLRRAGLEGGADAGAAPLLVPSGAQDALGLHDERRERGAQRHARTPSALRFVRRSEVVDELCAIDVAERREIHAQRALAVFEHGLALRVGIEVGADDEAPERVEAILAHRGPGLIANDPQKRRRSARAQLQHAYIEIERITAPAQAHTFEVRRGRSRRGPAAVFYDRADFSSGECADLKAEKRRRSGAATQQRVEGAGRDAAAVLVPGARVRDAEPADSAPVSPALAAPPLVRLPAIKAPPQRCCNG